MTDFSHLDALLARLTRENGRLQEAQAKKPSKKTANEIAFRKHEIMMVEREIDGEYKFLGIEPFKADDLTNDELLAELGI